MAKPEIVAAPAEVVDTVPEPLIRARFALYKHPSGGLVMGLRLEGEETTQHIVVPRAMLRMLGVMYGTKDPVALLEDLVAKRTQEDS